MRDLIIASIGIHALEMAEIVERINRITTSAGDLLWRCLARHFVEAAQ